MHYGSTWLYNFLKKNESQKKFLSVCRQITRLHAISCVSCFSTRARAPAWRGSLCVLSPGGKKVGQVGGGTQHEATIIPYSFFFSLPSKHIIKCKPKMINYGPFSVTTTRIYLHSRNLLCYYHQSDTSFLYFTTLNIF